MVRNFNIGVILNTQFQSTLLALLLSSFTFLTQAQDFNNLDSARIVPPPDSLLNTEVTDTTLANTQDSTAIAESDTIPPNNPIETTIDYSARDSIYYDVISRKVYMFGEAKVNYGELSIEAAEIEFDMNTNIVQARGAPDSTGNMVGLPIFVDKGQTYNAEEMTYNMKTQKGIIKGIVTQQGDGYIQSDRVKKSPDEAFFAAQNIYTTCNLDHPHFGIRAEKLKIVPNKYVISGPFNLELNDVPTPLGFAFGLFPFSKERNAGIIVPQYGESRERGFYLRDGGFFLPVNQYVGVKLLGQIYSYGGWGGSLDVDYRKRYSFQGRLNFSYNNVVRQTDDLSESESTDYWLRWSHSPQSRGSGRFSANVNVGSSSFNRNNSFNTSDYIRASFNSSVQYSKTFEGTPFSFGSNVRVNQNVNTEVTNLFPQMNFAMRRIYPLKGQNSNSKNPLTQINFSYSLNAQAEVTNDPRGTRFPFDVFVDDTGESDVPTFPGGGSVEEDDDTPPDFFGNFGTFLKDIEYGAVHRIPVSTNLTLLKFFQFTPSFNYTEYWYPRQYDYTWVDSVNAVVVDTMEGFARAFDWSSGVGMSTRLYAFYYPAGRKVDRIRHMITPSVSYSYRPDFSDPRRGFYQNVQVDSTGERFRNFSRYFGSIYGGPSQGQSSSMSFRLDNLIEGKILQKPDSTDDEPEYEKVPLIQNLGIGTSYNFAADSFNLSNISINARTQLFKNVPIINGVNVNVSANIDPYAYQLQSVEVPDDPEDNLRVSQRRTAAYAWEAGQGIGSLSNASINLSTRLSPPKKKQDKEGKSEQEKNQIDDVEQNPDRYVDFNIPWSLNIQYNLRYSKRGFDDPRVVQTLNFTGEVKLTEKWKVGIRSGYDFQNNDFAFTSLNIFRDLHCWQMQLNWIPFGPRQSYNIDISVRSSILQDLKISKRNVWFDR